VLSAVAYTNCVLSAFADTHCVLSAFAYTNCVLSALRNAAGLAAGKTYRQLRWHMHARTGLLNQLNADNVCSACSRLLNLIMLLS